MICSQSALAGLPRPGNHHDPHGLQGDIQQRSYRPGQNFRVMIYGRHEDNLHESSRLSTRHMLTIRDDQWVYRLS
jgi:hypothetical protein